MINLKGNEGNMLTVIYYLCFSKDREHLDGIFPLVFH